MPGDQYEDATQFTGGAPHRPSSDQAGPLGIESTSEREFIPGYRVVKKLGEGGMGVVYQAVQVSLNRMVAIKVVKGLGNDDTDFRRRFKREAIAGALLNHPNIVAVYDHGSYQNTVYMVLEFVEGKDCGEILRDTGPFDPTSAIRLIRDVTLALSHAAAAGVIHRDIKPANIMVSKIGHGDAQKTDHGLAKIMDFGIAALRENAREGGDMTELTQMGTVVGTPGYMSPEQAMGKEVDFRADIYSLGCTLYYLLTASAPWAGETAIEVFHNKMTNQLTSPADLNPSVSAGTVRLISCMMARDADHRYQTYEALLADIDAVLRGESPEAGPIPLSSQSIAENIAEGDLDQTELAATIQQAVVTPTPMAAADAPGKSASQGGSRRLMLAGCGVAAICIAAFVGFMMFKQSGDKDDSPESDPKPATAGLSENGNQETENQPNGENSVDGEDPAPKVVPKEDDQPDLAAVEAECRETLKELGEMPDDELRRELPGLRLQLSEKGKTLSPRTQRGLRRDLRALLVQRGESMAKPLLAEAQSKLKAGDYEAFSTGLAGIRGLLTDELKLTMVDVRKIVPNLRELFRIEDAAVGRGLGALERERWRTAREAQDPARRIRLLENFETEFWFSPDLEAARSMLKEAHAAAPKLKVTVQPAAAKVTLEVGGVEVGAREYESPRAIGRVDLRATAPGYFARELTIDHHAEETIELHLSPRPESPLKHRRNAISYLPLVGGNLRPVREDWLPATGAEFEIIAKDAAIRLTSKKDREAWSETKVRLQPFFKHGVLRNAKGFSVGVTLRWMRGNSELRLNPTEGASVVVGRDDEGFYFGTRSGDSAELQRLEGLKMGVDALQYFSVEWHGDVVVIRDELGVKGRGKVLGSVKMAGVKWATIGLAVKKAQALFQDLRIYPLVH